MLRVYAPTRIATRIKSRVARSAAVKK